MNKLKLLAPLAFFAITLASCDGNNNNKVVTDIPHLDRVNYAEASTFTSLNTTFQGMYDKQFTFDENETTTFNIFKQGVATFQYGVKISGMINISLITYDGRTLVIPINLNDWRINSTGAVTISWDIDKEYIKVADPYESYYIGRGTSKYSGDDAILKFYNSPIKGEKYKTALSYESNLPFSDIVLLESLANFTFEIPSLPRLNSINDVYRSIGFDLSGFLFGMGGGYSFPMNFLSPGAWGAIENVTSTIDQIVALKAIDELSTKFASNDEKTASIEAKFSDINLDTYSSLIWSATEGIINNVAGNVNLDYFAAFDDYFVRQQELFLDVLDFDLLALKLSEPFLHELANEFASGYIVTGGVIEVNDFNFSFHANEDVVKGCVAETYDPTSYTEI